MKKNWNQRLQEVLERTFQREAWRMTKWPGGYQAVGQYSDRLIENREKLKKEATS
jgi:hypothetical protein